MPLPAGGRRARPSTALLDAARANTDRRTWIHYVDAPAIRAGSCRNGEHQAKVVLFCRAMPLRICTVGFRAATGIAHSVEVEAETLMEAAGLGLARLKKDGWIEGLGPATKLEIQVREPGSHHVLSVQQLQKWVNSVNASPADVLKKAKIKHLLGY